MTCLNTDSKMSSISQYNLEEAYEKLTGHPLWDGRNLKQTLCVQCAQQLRNFSRFREQSLKARCLMMELLEKHEVITIQDIKMIQQTNNKLKNNLVSTMLGPDPCDMCIVDNTDGNRQTDSQETVLGVTVKVECIEDSQWEDEHTQRMKEENADCAKEEINIDVLKCESAAFMCTFCYEEFPHEHAYSTHVRSHLHDDVSDNQAPDSKHRTKSDLKSCAVKMYDIAQNPERAKIKVESLPQSLRAVSSHDNHTACEDVQYAASEDEVAATHNEPAESVLSETEPGTSGRSSRKLTFICDICGRVFTQKKGVADHIRIHTGEKPYSCGLCSYKSAQKNKLDRHMRTHTGEKPYSCKLCSYKCIQKTSLVCHMRTHTGEKPYSCDFCSYKCKDRSSLVKHVRIHTGEKPYSCTLCFYRSSIKGSLTKHMSTHFKVRKGSREKRLKRKKSEDTQV